MKNIGLNELRKLFLDFFESKEHLVQPSYPLVPQKDKSLLLINAGMAPLKPYFAGKEEPPKNRMATCQKCIRTGDIENVGKTARHATFFEMLGNFSFGDYFKEESLKWGWEFVTEYLQMPIDKLWATVYENDDEAFEIWEKQIGIPKEQIVRLGKEDNFWEIGIGPCGPCSELYFDRGEKFGCNDPNCKPGCECDRYVEFWNHVFTQFDKDEEGTYNPLPNPNIDTGMGLERVACIMQNVDSIFEIDTMKHILNKVCLHTNTKYNENKISDVSIRIITDHIRSIVFLISDGVLPSNEGRGYVLRRLIRRAARHGILLGKSDSFLNDVVEAVIATYGETYTELVEKQDYITKVIKVEEERFQETIHAGLEILNNFVKELELNNEKLLKGEHAFKLYDTYGFPLDLTKEILEEKNLDVDEVGFNDEMNKQRERARKARTGNNTAGWEEDVYTTLDKKITTSFVGYNDIKNKTKINAIVVDNEVVSQLNKDQKGTVILESSAFYGESGGQVGDTGLIYNQTFRGSVIDTKKGPNNQTHHVVVGEEGTIQVGDEIYTEVNELNRNNTSKNHTATHLLHKILKEVIGDHVQQAGSLVTPDRLRFDFTHFESLTPEQLNTIEHKINEKILQASKVQTFETSPEDAKQLGAEALFGEKYGDIVRVVKVGDESIELCGGTHVENSSEIGLFILINESGVASGVRRIEAITGLESYKYVKKQQDTINKVTEALKTTPTNMLSRLDALLLDIKEKEKEIEKLKSQISLGSVDDLINKAEKINGVSTIVTKVSDQNMNDLRKLGDTLKDKLQSGVILLSSTIDGKVNFVSIVTKDITQKGLNAGKIVKEAATITGGGGGGRPDMAQAGGKNPEKIDEALEKVKQILIESLK
ncbi:alanine--tRNA ligase [Serpentinicella sp. ANB-PHB4]|uniref:alanine--tRNA ligase n=1 Tax=Serpentinicella sp. ANB-PHB4 TaxID=3074076 RepID=UPI0028670EC5|nr:alanine--tRNA ligase [Serpentinicella sp. ANB-PHB4]MDR5658102.1 alanine--tRNA ligase [Serpentinicella sp. ANB-PHB4]